MQHIKVLQLLMLFVYPERQCKTLWKPCVTIEL